MMNTAHLPLSFSYREELTVNFKDALEKGLAALRRKYNYEEMRAALTHWFQSPNIIPPGFSASQKKMVIAEFASIYYGSDRNLKKEGDDLKLRVLWGDLPYPPPDSWDFTFIDLFAGIGGFRQAFQRAGGKCVFSCEWDKYAKATYEANYGETPYGDIRKIDKSEIPDHDVLCAGFPCQPFSLAGVSKKNYLGQKHGFEDETQGTLFFEIAEILRIKRPKAFMLENVKNLLSHDKGKTFNIIQRILGNDLGYGFQWKIVDGARWVPQHRERLFIVGYDPRQVRVHSSEIHIPEHPGSEYQYPPLSSIIEKKLHGYTIGPGTWRTLQRHKDNHAAKGNGFSYRLHKFPIPDGEITRTISARYHKDGAEVLIDQNEDRPRRLSVEEAMKLQGFDPSRFQFPVSKTQAYKQIGNSVVIPAVHAAAAEIAKILMQRKI